MQPCNIRLRLSLLQPCIGEVMRSGHTGFRDLRAPPSFGFVAAFAALGVAAVAAQHAARHFARARSTHAPGGRMP